jgi:hypothetical protein
MFWIKGDKINLQNFLYILIQLTLSGKKGYSVQDGWETWSAIPHKKVRT